MYLSITIFLQELSCFFIKSNDKIHNLNNITYWTKKERIDQQTTLE